MRARFLPLLLLAAALPAGAERVGEPPEGLAAATFAGGCFWCVEEAFDAVEGVEATISGYTGGESEDPSYRQVAGGQTRHAEAVRVHYDPAVVSYRELLELLDDTHDERVWTPAEWAWIASLFDVVFPALYYGRPVLAYRGGQFDPERAFELIGLGDPVDAATAREYGLVCRTYPDGDFRQEATDFVEELAGRSATALALSKRLLYQIDGASFEEGIQAGAEVNALARFTEDCREGIARFLDR